MNVDGGFMVLALSEDGVLFIGVSEHNLSMMKTIGPLEVAQEKILSVSMTPDAKISSVLVQCGGSDLELLEILAKTLPGTMAPPQFLTNRSKLS